jgi:hypothetical protein
MTESRLTVALFCFICLFSAQPAGAQTEGTKKSGATSQEEATRPDLKLTAIGNGTLPTGHWMAFRTYATPDGSNGRITYTRFDSLEDAKRQIGDWIKLVTKVTSQEHNTDEESQFLNDRIAAILEGEKVGKKETLFLIIRRDGRNCYFIESLSLQVAIQVEANARTQVSHQVL